MLIAAVGQALIETTLAPADPALATFLGAAKLSLANFEATLPAEHAWPSKAGTVHVSNEAALAALRAHGLNALAHANNHAFDLGPAGIAATRRAALDQGFAIAGSGGDLAAATSPALRQGLALIAADLGPQQEIVYAAADRAGIQPLRVERVITMPGDEFARVRAILEGLGEIPRRAMRVRAGMSKALAPDALDLFGTTIVPGESLAARWRVNEGDRARLTEAIATTAREVRVAVALHSHHWDADWTTPSPWYVELCRSLVDAGADCIIGTGVPVLQPLVFHRGRPILTSLGNFVFHTHRPGTYDAGGIDVWSSAAVRFRAGADSPIEVLPIEASRLDPAASVQASPRRLVGHAATRVMDRLTRGLSAAERARVVRA